MKKIVVVTSSRAEYGILKPLIIRLSNEEEIDLRLAVTGSHLSEKYGMTSAEIEADGIEIDAKIDILGDDLVEFCSEDEIWEENSSEGSGYETERYNSAGEFVSQVMARAIIGFAGYFSFAKPDAIVVLGDRYEIFAVCAAATNERIPIIHIHGGETTEGAVDEAFRHSISKMSYLHFTATKDYRKRVIQLGENPDRVFDVGALGVENALNTELYTRDELEESLRGLLHSGDMAIGEEEILGKRYAVGTFHPVTLEESTAREQTLSLLEAIGAYDDINYIFTKANADADGDMINAILEDYAKKHDNFYLFDSLGMKRYLSALKYAEFVIGNSSSGIIEAPSFHIPTINIGDRQRGRIMADSVINCEPNADSIKNAIEKAVSADFIASIENMRNPYGDGNTSEKIVKTIIDTLSSDKIDLKKSFYDL